MHCCLQHHFRALAVSALAALAVPFTPTTLPAQHKDEKSTPPAMGFSGVLHANFRDAHDSATQVRNGGRDAMKADVERAYLTFRAPAGDRGSIRVTTDVFNRRPPGATRYVDGWTVRLKDAYFQCDVLENIAGHDAFDFSARVGMLNSTVLDHEEGFWPRYLSESAVERSGFFSSSELGVAGMLSLPAKWGEVSAEIVDGSGHHSVKVKSHKDFAAHMSITPFGTKSGIIKSLTISPYIYRGQTTSALTHAPSAEYGTVEALRRDRSGVFAGIRSHALTVGAEWGRRAETMESEATIDHREAFDNSGTLKSAFAIARPLALLSAHHDKHSAFGVLMRIDKFHPYSDSRAVGTSTGVPVTRAANQLVITSVFWDLTSRATISIDEQDFSPLRGSSATPSRVAFAHMQVAF